MAEGVGTVEACRRVGVDRRTGHYWRPGPDSGRFLSAGERIAIADGLAAGRSRRAIAAELGRSPSTI
ncbi:helix-turn-helix domain-containing protein, partial [Amycolatopsis sp. La24]|uniref:helix-turn-helix domain-containing protein n=1 Tax=Amycolatopsis sp. La24 TaxID=3028304 RepID=UPI0023B11D48